MARQGRSPPEILVCCSGSRHALSPVHTLIVERQVPIAADRDAPRSRQRRERVHGSQRQAAASSGGATCYIITSPLGYGPFGAYGTPLRLPAVFGKPDVAAQQRADVDAAREQTLELSEKDVINVLEIVLNEYPVDRSSIFLMGHSMGSGGALFERLALLFERKQIPRIVVNVRNSRKATELLEATRLPSAQAARAGASFTQRVFV